MRPRHVLLSVWIGGAILAVWGALDTRAETSPDRAALLKAAEKKAAQVETDDIKAKKERFDYLVGRSKEFLKQGRYDQALVAIEDALAIYPDDKAAAFLRNKILTDSNKSREALLQSVKDSAREQAFSNMDKALIIPSQPVTYPETWAEVVARNKNLNGAGVRGPLVSEWEENLRKQLSQRISFSLEAANLEEAAKYLRQATGVGIVIDPKATIAKVPISLTASEIKLESALNQICRFAGAKWSMADTMVYISDQEVSDEPELATYDVVDLINPVRDFQAGGRALRAGAGGENKMRWNGQDFAVSVSRDQAPRPGAAAEQEKQGWDLVKFVKNTVAPGTWAADSEDGSSLNTIQYRNGKLVVSHNTKVQQQILKLLESFRKARTVQVMVSTRFIDIEKNYLEEIGVDWTGLEGGLNTISDQAQYTPAGQGGVGKIPISRGFSARGTGALDEFGNPWSSWYLNETEAPPFEAYQGLPTGYDSVYGEIPETWGRNPSPTVYWVDSNNDNVVDADEWVKVKRVGGKTDVGAAEINHLGVPLTSPYDTTFTEGGGLLLDLAYLSRYQVRALLTAVLKHRKGTLLTQPRLTCFNGERANIAVTSQINYIRSVQDQGLPEVGAITDGIVFEVVPYCSADRRYVTLELLPTLRTVRRPIRTQTIEVAEYLDDGVVVWTATDIQLPQILVKSVETFASVPDGGTLMLGGLSRVTEREGRAGVPLIDDIPIIKYLFSSWGKLDSRASLIILVKADILIQGEKEPAVAPAD